MVTPRGHLGVWGRGWVVGGLEPAAQLAGTPFFQAVQGAEVPFCCPDSGGGGSPLSTHFPGPAWSSGPPSTESAKVAPFLHVQGPAAAPRRPSVRPRTWAVPKGTLLTLFWLLKGHVVLFGMEAEGLRV